MFVYCGVLYMSSVYMFYLYLLYNMCDELLY